MLFVVFLVLVHWRSFWKDPLVYVVPYLLTMTDRTGIHQRHFCLAYMLNIFLLWLAPVLCNLPRFILFYEWHPIVCDNVRNLSLKTLNLDIFFGNQFFSFVFFTKIIIFVFAGEFFEFKSKDFIQGDYKPIKNLFITGSIVFSLSLKIRWN